MTSIFRVHPAIAIARIGSSQDIYIAPETAAGVKVSDNGVMGGLPIKYGTESDFIDEHDFRDGMGEVKRQAARFRIFAYPATGTPAWPSGLGTEIKLGSAIDGKIVRDILWTVHVANKKLNNYAIGGEGLAHPTGLDGYHDLATIPLRNGNYPAVPPRATTHGSAESRRILNETKRLTDLVIDPGPRAIAGSSGPEVVIGFDKATPASYFPAGSVRPATLSNYHKTFPDQTFKDVEAPLGPIETLGDIRVDAVGRLIVAGGFGKAVGVKYNGAATLTEATENGLWFDDASDGPVNATLVFDDGSMQPVEGAWVVTGDPGYAPQTRNVVSAWDDVFDIWVRQLRLIPSLYTDGFNNAYQPSFIDDVRPILQAAALTRWNTNLPEKALNAHAMIGAIGPTDDPTEPIPEITGLIRDPDGGPGEWETGLPLMPLSLGDMGKSFMTVSRTQYFFFTQWHAKTYRPGPGPRLGPGEQLDYVALANCLGGRYSPGIEVSFPVRDPDLYKQTDIAIHGPFRVNQAPLDYGTLPGPGMPFLTAGYTPLHKTPAEPGDVSKFMSVPWHTDYNSCAVHLPNPNPKPKDALGTVYPNNTLFWSWPAERPVQVYPKDLCTYDEASKTWQVGGQAFSVRGPGTETDYPADAGRFQAYPDYVANWRKVGFIIQGTQIADDKGANYGPDLFLEVSSQFDAASGPVVEPWPTADIPAAPS
jgi:hypothetical protein